MDNSRSKGSRKGSNLITAIAATFSCEVCRTCTGAGGDHATSPEASRRGFAPPAGHVLFPPRQAARHHRDGGAAIAHHRVRRRTRARSNGRHDQGPWARAPQRPIRQRAVRIPGRVAAPIAHLIHSARPPAARLNRRPALKAPYNLVNAPNNLLRATWQSDRRVVNAIPVAT